MCVRVYIHTYVCVHVLGKVCICHRWKTNISVGGVIEISNSYIYFSSIIHKGTQKMVILTF